MVNYGAEYPLRKDSQNKDLRDLVVTKGNYLSEGLKNRPYKIRLTERLWFEETGELGESRLNTVNLKEAQREDLIQRVLKLKSTGLSQRAIAEKLKQEGHKVGKTSVGELLKARA